MITMAFHLIDRFAHAFSRACRIPQAVPPQADNPYMSREIRTPMTGVMGMTEFLFGTNLEQDAGKT